MQRPPRRWTRQRLTPEKFDLLFAASSGNLISFPLFRHACTSAVSRPLFRRRGVGRVLQPLYPERLPSRCASSNIPAWRTGPRNCSSHLSTAMKTQSSISNTRTTPGSRGGSTITRALFYARGREHYRRDTSGRKIYDPSSSLAPYISATVAREHWVPCAGSGRLVHWADIIDGAQYPDAEDGRGTGRAGNETDAGDRGLEGSEIVQKIIRHDARQTLAEIVAEPEIQEIYQPLYERHLKSMDIIREQAQCQDGVVYFDLAGDDLEGYNKFIPYYLFPQSTYTVSVSPSSFRTKISVGSNPWAPIEPKAQSGDDLRALWRRRTCAASGAISLEPGALDKARTVAAEIVAELKR